MKKNEKLIIFSGAGFSKTFGFPDTDELWSMAKTNFSDDDITENIEEIEHSYPLSYFLEKKISDFELLLSVWTSYIQNYYDHFPDANWVKGGELENFLINLCSKLENEEKNLNENFQFCEIVNLLKIPIKNCSIIFWTTNYDRIIEYIIEKAGAQYCYLDNDIASIKLRKLHGSINWLTFASKPTRKNDAWEPPTLYTMKNDNIIIDFRNEKIPFEGTFGHPNIIPPIISKKYDEIFGETLAQINLDKGSGKNMLIIGYSFRESDIRINIILRKTMEQILKKGGKIFIVNPDNAHDKEIVPGFEKIINENIIHIQDEFSANVLKKILKRI